MAVPSSRSSRMRTSITSAASTSSRIDGATAPTRRCPRPAGLRLMREDFPAWLVEDFEYYDSPIPETVAVSGVPDRDFDPAGWTTPLAEATSFVDEGDVIDLGDRAFVVLHTPGPHCRFDLPVGRRERNDLLGRRDLRRCAARVGGSGGIRRFARAVAGPGRSRRPRRPRTIVRCARPSYDGGRDTGGVGLERPRSRQASPLSAGSRHSANSPARTVTRPVAPPPIPVASRPIPGHPRARWDRNGRQTTRRLVSPSVRSDPCPVVRFARRSPTTSVPARTPAPRRSPCGRWTIGRRGSRCVPRFRYRSSRAHAASPVGRVSGLGRPGDSADMLAAYGRTRDPRSRSRDRYGTRRVGGRTGRRGHRGPDRRAHPGNRYPRGAARDPVGRVDVVARSHRRPQPSDRAARRRSGIRVADHSHRCPGGADRGQERARHVARRFHDRPRRRNVPRVRRCRAARCDRGGVGRWPPDALRGRLRDVPGRGRRPHGACARCRRGRPARSCGSA